MPIVDNGNSAFVALWFEMDLGQGVKMTSAPGSGVTVYRQLLLPLRAPKAVEKGAVVTVAIDAHLLRGSAIWRWRVRFPDGTQTLTSSFDALPIHPDHLARRMSTHQPDLGPARMIDAAILTRLDGSVTQGDVAARIHAEFPGHFPRVEDALDRVLAVVRRHRD